MLGGVKPNREPAGGRWGTRGFHVGGGTISDLVLGAGRRLVNGQTIAPPRLGLQVVVALVVDEDLVHIDRDGLAK